VSITTKEPTPDQLSSYAYRATVIYRPMYVSYDDVLIALVMGKDTVRRIQNYTGAEENTVRRMLRALRDVGAVSAKKIPARPHCEPIGTNWVRVWTFKEPS
jgi:transcription initiation factor IIE alpha subunit